MTLLPPVDQNSPGFPSPTAGHDFGSRVELALAATNHLFNSRNAPRYVAQVLQGVTAVATKLERTTKPFTGVGPRELRNASPPSTWAHRCRTPLPRWLNLKRST